MDGEKLKALVAAVNADPGSLPKLVLADFLEESGDWDAGAGLRWCVKHGKWPSAHPDARFAWYTATGPSYRKGRGHCDALPGVIMEEMLRYGGVDPRKARTWLIAVRRLGWALRQLRELID